MHPTTLYPRELKHSHSCSVAVKQMDAICHARPAYAQAIRTQLCCIAHWLSCVARQKCPSILFLSDNELQGLICPLCIINLLAHLQASRWGC